MSGYGIGIMKKEPKHQVQMVDPEIEARVSRSSEPVDDNNYSAFGTNYKKTFVIEEGKRADARFEQDKRGGELGRQLVTRFHKGFNLMAAVCSTPGKGKSYLSARICQVVTAALNEHQKQCYKCRLHVLKSVCQVCHEEGEACDVCVKSAKAGHIVMVPFTVSQILFDPEEFFRMLDKLPSGSFIMIDESGVGLDAQKWQSDINRLFSYISETFRFKRINVIFCSPDLSQLTVNVRRVLICFIRVYGRGYARVYKLKSSSMGRQWLKGILIIRRARKPSADIVTPYEAKKAKAFAVLKEYALLMLEGKLNRKESNPYNIVLKDQEDDNQDVADDTDPDSLAS